MLNTWGASPRPVGSLLAFNVNQGVQVGSLSGGCIEDDLFDFLKDFSSHDEVKTTSFLIKTYGESAEENTRYLLPCGGTIELLIEPIFDIESHQHFLELKEALVGRRPIARSLDFSDPLKRSYSLLKDAHISSKIELSYNKNVHQFYHRLDPAYRLLLIGMGDVTLYLSEFAETLGFDVTICDPRAEYNKRFQTKHLPYPISYELPDDLVKSSFLDSFCAILCLAHDPKLDDMALLEALVHSKAFYIGAMGSIKTSQARLSRLQVLGITEQQLNILHAPIGLDIHSKTPQEIAVAISAELIASRYQHKLAYIGE